MLASMGLHYGNSLLWLKHGETQPHLLILGLHATLINATEINWSKPNKRRQRGKHIRDGLEARGARRGCPAYLQTLFKFMVMSGPTLGFGLGLMHLTKSDSGCQGRNQKSSSAARAG